MTAQRLDLGSGHWLEYTSWSPDRELNPQYDSIPDTEKWGAIVGHPLQPGDEQCAWRGECTGSIAFDGPAQQQLGERPTWTVECWEPLTISPSLLCHCGDHGFIRSGQWVTS
jgi:hypothetical protein